MRPYLPARSKARRWQNRRIKLYLVFSGLFLLFIGGTVLVRDSGLFDIKKITVYGFSENVEQEKINKLKEISFQSPRARFLGATNYFSWPKEIDFNTFEFTDVAIEKKLFKHSVTITVNERKRYAVWCQENSCFWFDKNDGLIMQSSALTEGQLIFTINEINGDTLTIGNKVLSEKLFTNLLTILDSLEQQKIVSKKISVTRALQEVEVMTGAGARLIFSLRFNPEINLSALRELLKQTSLRHINYIDLTVENKVFLKVR